MNSSSSLPTPAEIRRTKSSHISDYGNGLLYQLCKDHFEHNEGKYIVAKTLFIGRIYAAALERNAVEKSENNDDFYAHTVVSVFKNSRLDDKLKSLKKIKVLAPENITEVLQTHGYLVERIMMITGHKNTSFCSKYLHFHLPGLFFIYDKRVREALGAIKMKLPDDLAKLKTVKNIDPSYTPVFLKCFAIKRMMAEKGLPLTNRQLDKILVARANT
ncbi:MAG: hypothetical protein ABIY90_18360 [Puia sp.]